MCGGGLYCPYRIQVSHCQMTVTGELLIGTDHGVLRGKTSLSHL